MDFQECMRNEESVSLFYPREKAMQTLSLRCALQKEGKTRKKKRDNDRDWIMWFALVCEETREERIEERYEEIRTSHPGFRRNTYNRGLR